MTAQASKTDPVAALKHNGGEGRMALAACSWSCLTSLSEATRSKLQHDCPGFQNGIFRHTEIPWQWRVDDACSLQPVVPNVAFKFLKPQDSMTAQASKRTPLPHWNTKAVKDGWRLQPKASKTDPSATLKHHGSEGQWRTDGACGLHAVVPNAAFWIHKKLAPTWLPRLPKRNFRHTEIPWQWRVDDACSLQPVVPNVAFWSHKTAWLPRLPSGPPCHTETPWQWRTDGACSLRLPKRTPAPHWNTMAVKGSEGRMAPAACMRSCLTPLSESTRNWLQHDCPGSKILLN